MAERKRPIQIKLSPEHRRQLENTEADMKELHTAMGALKELGFDMTQFEEKLIWAEKAREILLKRFS